MLTTMHIMIKRQYKTNEKCKKSENDENINRKITRQEPCHMRKLALKNLDKI